MSEIVNGRSSYSDWKPGKIFRPDRYPHLVMGSDPEDVAALGREVAHLQMAIRPKNNQASGEVMPSWAGGGRPRQDMMDEWVIQATRELSGYQPTLPPISKYFEPTSSPVTEGVMSFGHTTDGEFVIPTVKPAIADNQTRSQA